MTEFRCELLSADQLAALASGPLPPGVAAERGATRRFIAISISIRPTIRSGGAGSCVACASAPTAAAAVAAHRRRRTGRRRSRVERDDAVERAWPKRSRPTTPSCSACAASSTRRCSKCARPRGRSAHAASAARDWLRRPRLAVHLDRVTRLTRRQTARRRRELLSDVRAPDCAATETELAALERALEEEHGVRPSAVAHARTRRAGDEVGATRGRPRGAALLGSRSSRIDRARCRLGAGVLQSRAESARVSASRAVARRGSGHPASRASALSVDRQRERRRVLHGAHGAVVAAIGGAPEEPSDDGLTPARTARRNPRERRGDLARASPRCLRECYDVLAERGMHVCSWSELSETQRETLARPIPRARSNRCSRRSR